MFFSSAYESGRQLRNDGSITFTRESRPSAPPTTQWMMAPRLHDVLGAQHGDVLGDDGLLEMEGFLELLHAVLAPDEDLANADADGMREGLEELRLERLQ
jgi:hypothetical protein